MNKKRVLIVDDHAILRMGLSSLINAEKDLEVVGDAEDGETALRKARKLKPDVVIMDLMMPGISGAETTRRLLEDNPDAHILVLTTYGTSDALSHALQMGALGAAMKSIPFPELVNAIRTVAAGKRFVAPDIERILAANPPIPDLSPRQSEILEAIARGLSNADIAKQLDIGPDMVKAHVNALFQKIGAANRAEAVAIAMRKHLLLTLADPQRL